MRRTLVVAGVSVGCVLLSPVAASADGPIPGKPTTMSTSVSGNSVTITGTCAASGVDAIASYDVYRGQEPKQSGLMYRNGKRYSITFGGVWPGWYVATMQCLDGGNGSAYRTFSVGILDTPTPTPAPTKPTPKPTKPKPKPAPQVVVKPQGAPQTGGGPADDGSAVPALVAGGAIVLVGAGGAWALRRRASSQR
jgi:hypothetical protein